MIEKFVEKIFRVPGVVLDKSIDTCNGILNKVRNQRQAKNAEAYWHILGPGLTTGAADDDPSGIATYSQTGAQTGFQLLWLSGFTFPLMAVVQEMCARIGLVTGCGLAANISKHYPKRALYICSALLFIANTFNIGADLGAMAQATQLVVPNANFSLLVIGFAVFSLMMQIFTSYKLYARYLKYLTSVLLAYIFTAFTIDLNWGDVLYHAVIPSFTMTKDHIVLITAVLGTTISPYLFFWQASQEVEEQSCNTNTKGIARMTSRKKEISRMRIDVWSGMFFSNAVMFFIIAVCAGTLYSHGLTDISTAADAAAALRPLAGENAFLLFAVGIIGTGLLAIPILAGSVSYAFGESFKWKTGLDHKLNKAYPFYGVIIVSMILGLMLQFTGINPLKALIYSAVANALVAPVVLIFVVLISSNKAIMGDKTNSAVTTFIGWAVTGIMIIAGLATILSLIV
jgi:NRAMP (natural resistance-associated macrophage protein)-like metal ion transporter